jgi:hypothetical protein
MTASVLALIDRTRWRRAVFTSFTLSLTYLESYVLPRLRRQGCQSLSVYVDLAGYRDSLMEQRARAVGRDYSVIPVAVRSGIFHPKLVHLQAQEGDDDLLLVGSGNLTYPGHGGNVEVLDVLRPAAHAVAFRQAADFMRRLVSCPTVSIPDAGPLLATAERLADLASRGADTEAVQFIDCLETPAFDQFVARAKDIAPSWSEALVLSPYHHPQGEPVRKLVSAVGARRLVVGVPTAKEGSSFPFHVAQTFGLESVGAQMPVADKGTRRSLHAKWFELRRPGAALALTGSFNATLESFCKTTNVECGVVRLLTGGSDLWADCPIPTYVRGDFPARDATAAICLFASFDTSSRLVGRCVGGKDVAGTWNARLQDVDEILHEGLVEVDADGAFIWAASAAIEEVTADALQVTLTRGHQRARGWVQVSRVLNMRSSDRQLLQSLSRVANDTSEEDDTQVVLDYIAQELGNLLRVVPAAVASRSSGGARNQPNVGEEKEGLTPQQFEALQDPWDLPPRYDSGLMLEALKEGRQGWDQLKHICAALLELPTIGGQKLSPQGRPADPWPALASGGRILVDDDKDAANLQKLEGRLDEVRATFQRHLDAAELAFLRARTPEERAAIDLGRSRLWLLASLVEMRFRLLKLDDVASTQEFLWRWLKQVADLQLDASQKQALAVQVCGVAAACSLWLLETTWLANDVTHTPKQVHRFLDRFFNGAIDREHVSLLAKEWLKLPAGQALTQTRTEDALTALVEVLSEPTERQVLAKLLEDGLEPHGDLALRVFGRAHYPTLELLLAKRNSHRAKFSQVAIHELSGCPQCHVDLSWVRPDGYRELDRDISWRLRQLGFAKCPRGHYLVVKEAS